MVRGVWSGRFRPPASIASARAVLEVIEPVAPDFIAPEMDGRVLAAARPGARLHGNPLARCVGRRPRRVLLHTRRRLTPFCRPDLALSTPSRSRARTKEWWRPGAARDRRPEVSTIRIEASTHIVKTRAVSRSRRHVGLGKLWTSIKMLLSGLFHPRRVSSARATRRARGRSVPSYGSAAVASCRAHRRRIGRRAPCLALRRPAVFFSARVTRSESARGGSTSALLRWLSRIPNIALASTGARPTSLKAARRTEPVVTLATCTATACCFRSRAEGRLLGSTAAGTGPAARARDHVALARTCASIRTSSRAWKSSRFSRRLGRLERIRLRRLALAATRAIGSLVAQPCEHLPRFVPFRGALSLRATRCSISAPMRQKPGERRHLPWYAGSVTARSEE